MKKGSLLDEYIDMRLAVYLRTGKDVVVDTVPVA